MVIPLAPAEHQNFPDEMYVKECPKTLVRMLCRGGDCEECLEGGDRIEVGQTKKDA